MTGADRPTRSFDAGLQHERTALAWERTAVALMVGGVILVRFAAAAGHPLVAVLALLQTALGGAVLIWAGFHYEELHGPIRRGEDLVHPLAARLVGLATIAFTAAALFLAVLTGRP